MSIRGDFVPSNDESNGHALRNSFSALSSQMGDDDGGWMPIVEEHTSATGTPMKLVPLLQLYGTTSGGTNGNGLRNTKVVGSRKGKARKLDVASMAKSKEPLPNKPLLIYTRRNKNAHKNDVSKPGLSFHERLLNRAKLLATGRQTVEPNHVPESRTFVTSPVEREVKRTTELEYGIVKVEVSVGNGESIHDYDKGSVDNPVVHYKGIEGGGVLQGSGVSMSVESSALGLNIVITPDSDDHDGIEKLKKEILGQSANGSIFAVGSRDDNDQMKKKSQKKRKFEGIDLLPEKRLKGNDYDGTWLRESRARKQRAARLGLNWNSQTVNQTGSSPSSTQISEAPKGGYSTASSKKKWIEVGLNGVEPEALLGYKCRVYWPMDDDWYSGVIDKYNSEKNQHHAIPFSRGFQSNFQFKCKRMPFVRGLDEAWRYLKERKLPEEMANLHIDVVKSGCQIDNEKELELSDADEDCMGDERSEKVKKSIDGSTPTECWKKIYIKLEKAKQKPGNGFKSHVERKRYYSGSYMFGFSNQRIAQLIQALPNSRACSKYTDWIDKSAAGELEEVLPAGYRPVQVQWKDLDRCSVCHMEEEYVNNLFLQCDNCRMMVIEYTGEIVRPIIADIREHFIYNSLVPNCYSRVINVGGEDRIIIFAKRDIKQWEELTYDYRFFSIDEQLACYCGFPRCRGIVNVNDAEEQIGKICVPCRELIDWTPDDVK